MSKNYSRIISFLLAIVMVVGLMPAQVFATETKSAYPTVQLDQEFTVEITTSGGYGSFTFIPETSGLYIFESYSDADTYGYICDADGNAIFSNDDGGNNSNFMVMCPLTAGETYILQAKYYHTSITGSFTAKITLMEVTSLSLDTEVQQEAGTTKYYSFIPETDEQYMAYASSEHVNFDFVGAYNLSWYEYNEFWGTTDCLFQAPVGKPMYIMVTSSDEALMVGVTGQHEVESITYSGPALDCVYNPRSYESYTVNLEILPAHANVEHINWAFEDTSLGMIWRDGPDTCKFWSTGLGETCLIVSNGDTEMLRIPVTSEALPAMNLDEPITTTFTGYYYYTFTPEESGVYCFYISETDGYVPIRCAGEDAYGYRDSYGSGCDIYLNLEDGVTYYPYIAADYETTCTFAVTRAVPVTSITASVDEIRGSYVSGTNGDTVVYLTYGPEYADTTNVEMTIADTNVARIAYRSDSNGYVQISPVGVGFTELIITAGDAVLRIPITYEGPATLELGVCETVYSEDSSDVSVFRFEPEVSGSYAFCFSACDNAAYIWLEDSDGICLGSVDYRWYEDQSAICASLEAGESYYLYARSNSNTSVTFDVTVIESPAVETITSDVTELYMAYLSTVSSSYYVGVTVNPAYADVNSLQWQILDTSVAELDGPYGYRGYVNPVGTGETELVVTAPSGAELRIPITVTEPTPIYVGDQVTVTGDDWHDETWFVFVPEETAYYSIYVGDCTSSACVVLSNRYDSWIDNMFAYADDYSDYICAELTAGETYYLCCSPSWEEATEFTVNLIESPEVTDIIAETTSIQGVYVEHFSGVYTAYISVEPKYAAGSISWTIGDTSVAQISHYESDYCVIYAVGAGETTLTASTEDGASVSIPVVFTEPQVMEPDVVYTGTSQKYNDYIYYSFTPEETANYIFTVTECDSSTYFELSNNLGYYISGGDAYSNGYGNDIVVTLFAGEHYYLKVRSYSSNPTNFSVMCYKEPEITEITSTVTAIEGFYAPGTYTEVFVDISILPGNASMSSLDYSIWGSNVAYISGWSDDGVYVGFCGCGMEQLVITANSGVSLAIPIMVQEPWTLWLDTPVQISSDNDYDITMCSFTPETGGDYTFYVTASSGQAYMYLLDSDGNYLGDGYDNGDGYSRDISATLEAGQTYTLVTHSNNDSPASYTVTVIEAPEIESITANRSQISAVYIPGNSASYYISFIVTPEHAATGTLRYEILDTSVAQISYTANGSCSIYITGVGETELVVSTEDGVECRIPIVVTGPEVLVPGNTYMASTQVDRVWYTFTPEETGEYIIYSNRVYNDPVVTLYYLTDDGDLQEIDYSDDYDGRDFYLRNELQAGVTYYYCIYYYGTDPAEPATEIYFGQPGEITSISVNTEAISGYIDPSSWYELDIETTPKYSDLSVISVASMNEEVVRVKYEDGKHYYALVGEGTSSIIITWGDEEYEIQVTAEVIPALELNVPVDAVSENYDDMKMFTFTPAEDGHYTFYLSNVTRGVRYILFDADGGFVNEGSAGSDWGTDLCAEMEAGQTYTLWTWSSSDYSAAYTVTVIEAPTVESITPSAEQVNMVYVPGAYLDTYVSVEVTPEHAAVSSLHYEILDTSVAVVYDISGPGCTIYPTGVGETVLVISTEDGVECRIPIVVTAPEELVPGNTYMASTQVDSVWYTFTPEETGEYIIYSNRVYNDPIVRLFYLTDDGDLQEIDYCDDYDGTDFYLRNVLQAGVTYYYCIDYYRTNPAEPATEIYFGQPGEITDITVNVQEISNYVGMSNELDIESTPKYTDLSDVSVTSTDTDIVTVTCIDGVWYYELVGEGTAQITIAWGDEEYEINVEAKTIPALELGVEEKVTSRNYNDPVYFQFTPEESGLYTFYFGIWDAPVWGEVYTADGDHIDWISSYENSGELFVELEAGVTYMLCTASDYNREANYTVGVVQTQEVTDLIFDVNEVSGVVSTSGRISFKTNPAHGDVRELEVTVADETIAYAYVYDGTIFYELLKVGETVIIVTLGDLEWRIPVTVTAPPEMALNVPEMSDCTDVSVYSFTPAQDGSYTFYFSDVVGNIAMYLCDEDGEYIGAALWLDVESIKMELSCELEAGETYLIRLYPQTEGTVAKLTVTETPVLTGLTSDFDEINLTYVAGFSIGQYVTVSSLPAHADLNELKWTMADENVAVVEYFEGALCCIYATGLGETELIATLGEYEVRIPVKVTAPEELPVNTTMTFTEQYVLYTLTPGETGEYTFTTTGDADPAIFIYEILADGTISTILVADDTGDSYNYDTGCTLEGGKQYVIRLYNYDSGVPYEITITGPAGNVLYGDVNKDGSVDNMDATLILQYAAGWNVELKDTVAADVNGDGSIDNMDATLILQFAAGWNVTLGPSN